MAYKKMFLVVLRYCKNIVVVIPFPQITVLEIQEDKPFILFALNNSQF